MSMTWVLIAIGFTGALTLEFVLHVLHRCFFTPPSVTAHHSPKGGCTEAVVREIGLARREILVQAYSFTSKPITEALIQARTRGVHVEVLLDHSNEKEEHTELPVLLEQNIPTLIDADHAIAHNKIMIVDKKTLITGSFNFTHQAEASNAENLLIFKGHRELVNRYRENYMAHKSHSRAPQEHIKAVVKKAA